MVKNLIEQRALELGFDACHFTTAAAPESAGRFQRWLDDGRHGEMAYLARNSSKRTDPQQVLPEARSVITLASAYSEDGSCNPARPAQTEASLKTRNPKPETRSAGLIARYARFADYHDVLAGPLKQLSDFVTQLGGSGTRSLWYVDTGPLLERDLAQRAGLGFIGKHTNLIGRRLGNWFFLAEIITTLKLAPDAPEKNRCGSCVRCITACPTQAITAPFQLDARRCISYLTIELKGSIPVEFRPAIGKRIYGCDDCLEACPWNKFAQEGKLMKPHTRPDLTTPDLTELLSLDETEFKRRFAGTPMLRTKRRGLLRNVCVALGNIGDDSALPALRRAAADPEPLIAEHALWAIGRIEFRRTEAGVT
jgi:epoxyqueuosine reductase